MSLINLFITRNFNPVHPALVVNSDRSVVLQKPKVGISPCGGKETTHSVLLWWMLGQLNRIGYMARVPNMNVVW